MRGRIEDVAVVSRSKGGQGYILFEALIALTVLSISIYVIQEGIRQAVIARGHAKDYTQARFLLEDLVNQIQLQPLLHEASRSGSFEGINNRFSWTYSIYIIEMPLPPPPPSGTQNPAEQEMQLPVPFLGKIEATVRWQRSGSDFEESVQTLFAPERVWLPPPPPEPPAPPPGGVS